LVTQDALALGGADDALGAVKACWSGTGGLQGIGEREPIIRFKEDSTGCKGGIECAGEAAGEDEFGGELGERLTGGGFGVTLADAGDGQMDLRVGLGQAPLEGTRLDGKGEGDEEWLNHVR
jgi:hypothetical protein